MSIANEKIMNLADGKVLYDDLRGRVDQKYTKPSAGIAKTDLESEVQSSLNKVDDLNNNKAPVIINSASGAIASFDDAIGDIPLKSCVASLTPVQDLHGYANPWPAGGGKNKCPVLNSGTNHGMTLTVDQFGVCTLEGQSDGVGQVIGQVEFTLPAGSYIANGGQADYTLRVYNKTDASTLAIVNSTTVNVPFTLASEKTIQVFIRADVTTVISSSGLKYYPMIRLSTESDATFAPYSNICPISGRTGVNVSHCGKNLFDTTDSEAGTLDADGNPISSSVTRRTKFILVSPNTVYTYSGTKEAQTNGVRVHGYDAYKNGDSLSLYDETNQNFSFTFTTPSDCRYIRVTYRTSFTNVQLELGESASEYEPYTGDIVNVEFPSEVGTAYSGTLDVTTGELVVTYKSVVFDGSETYGYQTSGSNGACYVQLNEAKRKENYIGSIFCDKLRTYQSYYTILTYGYVGISGYTNIGQYEGQNWIYLSLPNCHSASECKAWVTANNLCIVYELATPLVYHLTPVEIQTLLGQNNIWADTGNISVLYGADTKAYIDQNEGVKDVQINGTSILQNGVANVPKATSGGDLGVVTGARSVGTQVNGNGVMTLVGAVSADYKNGTNQYNPVVPFAQHESVFYGLAKAAGDTTQAGSQNPFGYYTIGAKSKISQMLNGAFGIVGATPSFTALPGIRYICGECTTLTIVAPASGCFDVKFTSGSTPTVLTVTSARSNTTIKWANGFDPTSLDANTTYEINILDGEYGVVGSWT